MRDRDKTKEQLINELAEMRRRVADLEAVDTERQRAEEALRESESRLSGMLSSMVDLVFAFDNEGRFNFYHSPHSGDLYFSPGEFIGKKHSEVMPPHLNEPFAEAFEKTKKGEVAEFECWLEIGGRVRWFSAKLSPVFLEGEFAGSVAVAREITADKRAEEELTRHNQELAALNAIATTMMQSALDLDEVLQRIADGVVEGLGCNTALIFLLDEKEGVFKGSAVSTRGKIIERINAIVGFPLVQLKAPARSDFNEALSNALDGHLTIKHDLYELTSPLLSRPVCSALQQLLGSRTFLVLPLLARGKVVGGIFASTTREELSEEDIETIMTFANQAAIAIENARLYEETRQRALEQETLREAALALTTALDRNEVIDRILAQLQQVVPYDSASVQLLKENRMQIVGGRGFSNLPDLLGISFPADGDNPNSEVIRTRAPFIVQDAPTVYEGFRKGPHVQTVIRSWLGVPMLIGERLVGMIALDKREPAFYTQEHARLAEAFAAQAAVAIENAGLFEETERLKKFNENVVQGVAEAILIEDAQGILAFANPAAEELLGYTCEELIGRHWTTIVPEDKIEKVRQELAKRRRGTLSHYETTLLSKEGQVIPVIVSACPLFEEGKFTGVLSAFTDIRKRVRAEREIEERRMYLEGVLRAAPDAIVTLDAHHRIVEWNSGAERLFGYSREEVVGQNVDHLLTNTNVFEKATEFTQAVMTGMRVPPTETVRHRKDGSPVDVIVAGSPILVRDKLIGAVAVYTDITARKRMEEALRAMALVDDLTGLYNRRGFFTMSQQQLKMADRTKVRMVLLFADFDNLKHINDTLGHLEGDRALIEIANVFRETFRESDIIARIGGDEFVVLAIETDSISPEILATRLQENLEARNAKGDRRYNLSLSTGTARYDPERPCLIDELLARADRAMYERKRDDTPE